MTTVNGAVAAICWPNSGDESVPPAGQVIVISGFGGAVVATADDVVGAVVAARRACVLCVVGAAVDVVAARASAAGVVSVGWSPKLPMIPSARTPAPMP